MSTSNKKEEWKTTQDTSKLNDSDLEKVNGTSNTSTTYSEQNNEESIPIEQSKTGLEKNIKYTITFSEIFEDDYLFELMLDYFSLNDIYLIFPSLNSKFQFKLEESNYFLLGKLTDKLNITSTYLTSDIPCHRRIVDLYKSAMKSIKEQKEIDLKPNPFTTDSGLVGTNMWYGMHNIFLSSNNLYSYYIFSSNKGEKNHVQSYLCCPGAYDSMFSQKSKKNYELEPGSKIIYVPYEKTSIDGSPPTFKIPRIFEINCKNQGFWYYTDNLALFFSEDEVEHDKFNKSTKFFDNFKSVDDAKNKLPVYSEDTSNKGFTIFEFDLSKKNEILKTMGISKFVSIPLVYINIDKNIAYGKTLSYEFKQIVAAKYMSMKLICWASFPSVSQLDMFPCALKGISLEF